MRYGVCVPNLGEFSDWWLEGFRPAPGEYAAALRRIEARPFG
jgi:hypothetical protein